MNDFLQKLTVPLIMLAVVGGVEMRIAISKQSAELQNVRNQLDRSEAEGRAARKILDDVKDEQLRRKEVIDWVREYRQRNNWGFNGEPKRN